MDRHWRSYEDLCHPCFVGYDFIGKYETLSDDVDHVLKLIGEYGKVQFPNKVSVRSKLLLKQSSTASVRNASSVLGYQDVSASDVGRLVALYKDDYSLYTYPYPPEFSGVS
jgi:Sulfotransferase family